MTHRAFTDQQKSARPKSSLVRRLWRPAVGLLVAGAISVGGAAVPWHHAPVTSTSTLRSSGVVNSTTVIDGDTTSIDGAVSLKTWGKAPKLAYPHQGSAAVSVVGAEPIDSHNGGKVRSTASVAKAMTAYVVLKDHPLKNGSNGPKIRISKAEAAAYPHQARQGQSLVPVRAGEQISERDALEALMLASANNMAQILARWDGGNVPHFLGKMNSTAKSLGMSHTHYTDPSGFTASTKSTATDQLKLAQAAMKRWDYRGITSLKSAYIPVKGRIINYNKLLSNPAVVGLKTGSMRAAGGCLLFAAKYKIDGQWVMVLGDVFGQSGPNGILHAAWDNSATLLNSAHRSLHTYKITWKGRQVGTVPGSDAKLVAAKDVKVVGFSGMTMKGKLHAKITKNAKDGAVVGKLRIAGASVPVTLDR